MSYPCVDEDQFDPNGGAPTPREWLQYRHVATAFAAGIEVSDIPPSAVLPDIGIHVLQAVWTNDSPIPLQVYGLITRGGSQWALNAKNRLTIDQFHGTAFGPAPADPALTLVSRYGGGGEFGVWIGPISVYGIIEDRIGPRTALIGDTITLPPGQTYKAKCEVRATGIQWDPIPPGNQTGSGSDARENERRFLSGDTQIDLFAYPLL